ncbi:NACHT domain-containing protein [Nostoc sp.]|uniref:NACHT domain-containing protein n=1 Tax=Nostoc sp. TaxID=1180 RepID=UPI002FFCFDF2
MPQPIELTGERGIYSNINILEKITGRRRLDISELVQDIDPDDFERFGLNKVKEKRVPGLEAVQRHNKLMVLGKPGAGKTTFLKYLAMQCIEGQYLTNRVPLFITLKDFAEAPKQPDVLKYIAQQLSSCGVNNANLRADQLLKEGKALVLLDGLDEVREEDTKRVLRQIRDISDHFYTNQFVITCRIAAKEYTFESFTEVEVADFDEEQIGIFAQNWFQLSDPVKAERFMHKLEDNESIRELASSPLLLTLLCLVFGESADFPANRSELYKEGLDILLKKWDAKRNIERDQVYKTLSLQRKEDLLSQIALTTFEQKDYFFKQKTVELYIANFIKGLDDTCTEPKKLEQDSQAVLKSIAAQHGLLVERAQGVYGFSSRTLQAYFAAREIVTNSAFEKLLRYINDIDWREIFLLTIGMMKKADELLLLMNQKISLMRPDDNYIKSFLSWISQKCSTISSFDPFAVWTFYLTLDCDLFSVFIVSQGHTDSLDQGINHGCNLATNTSLISAFNTSLSQNKYHIFISIISESKELALDRYLVLALNVACNLDRAFNLEFVRHRSSNKINSSFSTEYITILNGELLQILEYAYTYAKDNNLKKSIYQLKREINQTFENTQKNHLSIKHNRQYWIENLRKLMIEHRNIGHNWQFNDAQIKLLKSYYNANKLLVDCLNSDCYVSREVKQEIENTLLLLVTNE